MERGVFTEQPAFCRIEQQRQIVTSTKGEKKNLQINFCIFIFKLLTHAKLPEQQWLLKMNINQVKTHLKVKLMHFQNTLSNQATRLAFSC